MNEVLLDPFRHNDWATGELLTLCRGLDPRSLEATAVGTYGGVRATLQHILDAEGYYVWLLTGAHPAWWARGELPPASVAELERWTEEMAARWDRLLSGSIDPERRVADEQHPEAWATVGVLLAQALNHGNEHRAQVCTVLTALGIEPPRIDAWAYGVATGRHVEASG